MTLIAAVITKIDVVQVSDRLVSDRGIEFDPTANKQLVYLGPRWAVSMAYTGTAYIGKLPTDEWIAEALIQKPLPRIEKPWGPVVPAGQKFPVPHNSMPEGLVGSPVTQVGRQKTFPDLGVAMFHLAGQIDRAFDSGVVPRDAAAHGLEIVVAGWQWGVKKARRPVMFSLIRKPQTRCFRESFCERNLRSNRSWCGGIVPGGHVQAEDKAFLKAGIPSVRGPVDLEDLLINTVVRVSSRKSSVIGNEIMSVGILSPEHRTVRLRFVPVQPRQTELYGRVTNVAYTPFVISPSGIISPMMIIGNSSYSLHGWRILIAGTPPTGAVIGAGYPQRRKRLSG